MSDRFYVGFDVIGACNGSESPSIDYIKSSYDTSMGQNVYQVIKDEVHLVGSLKDGAFVRADPLHRLGLVDEDGLLSYLEERIVSMNKQIVADEKMSCSSLILLHQGEQIGYETMKRDLTAYFESEVIT
jgi:hypothetical protein